MRFLILFIALIGSSLTLFSQELGEKKINGEKYTVYAVQQGNTLYSLHQKYGVTVDAIVKANPGIEKGLRTGQIIYIPLANKNEEDSGYILYKVQPHETLFGISRKYNCSVKDLMRLNPGSEKGIDVGQELKIPKKSKLTNHKDRTKEKHHGRKSMGKYTLHTVVDGETLYSIAKKNHCSVKQLIQLNPEAEEEIKIGQTLKIPSSGENKITKNSPSNQPVENRYLTKEEYDSIQKDSIISYTVHKGETMYSIAKRFMVPMNDLIRFNHLSTSKLSVGQVIQIPLKKEMETPSEFGGFAQIDTTTYIKNNFFIPRKSHYSILVLLPMDIEKNKDIISGMYDNHTQLNPLTNVSVQFLMGAQMAIDSLEKLGLSGEVKFFDTQRDMERLKSILDTNSSNWDIVIGPFFPKQMEYTAKWGLKMHTPIIAVTRMPTIYLKNNPYLFSMIPSRLTLIGGMAKYLAVHGIGTNMVLIQGKTEEEKEYVQYFKKVYTSSIPKGLSNPIISTLIGKANGSTLSRLIKKEKKNYFICLSDDVKRVMRFVNALNAAKNISRYDNADVTMVGLKEWNDFSPLNDYYKNRFDFTYGTSTFLDYDTLKTIKFIYKYRKRYGSDPSKYAFYGFDVTLSQLSTLLLNNVGRNKGISDSFNVQSIDKTSGRENRNVFIVRQNDFELFLLKQVLSPILF